ncbi:cation channel sperm-associated protein subunit epsilon [Protopterus annectens]|uniref:cation channel sperm-associated protein subunit epsilon n=1 Tax=Protopterus annectens TaxID=7888 RepID=UPI001CFA294D|nr:cation channel sperm-associated protein subunit epsilon [Protopterus annectens]
MAGSKKFTVIAVWTTHELYLGNASGTSFSKIANSTKFLNILKLPIQSTVNILTVSSGSRPPEIGVLLKVCNTCDFTDKRLWLLIFDEETDKWSVNSLFARTHSNLLPKGPFTMEFFQSALPSLLLGNNETIFYSLGNNTQRGKLLLPGTNNFVNASGGSIIHQITTDISGNVLIKMANNKLFFSKIGTEDTIILPDWENADTDMIFYSVPTGNTYVLKLKGTWVQRQVYPLEMEIFSATANLTNGCLYTKFYHNMSVPVYYLDMGEQLFAWAQIIYKEDFGISMRLAKNRDLLHVDQNMELEITNGMCIRNLLTISLTAPMAPLMLLNGGKGLRNIETETKLSIPLETFRFLA